MADETKAQIQIGADSTQLEAGVARAKKSLADLGVVGQAAGQATMAGLSGIEKELDRGGLSAKAYSAALRQVPAQFTDIFTGLASGQRPLTVLIQQGGQLKDVFGGVAPAARALTGYVLGLINPLSLTAAAAAAVGYAMVQGEQEATAYARALILSGNAAGVTTGMLQQMTAQIAGATGATQGAAADAVAQVAQTGEVAAQNLQKVSQAAVVFERATGTAIKSTVAQFAELGRAPLDASVKLNASMHYLTASTYEQIRALDQAGRQTEAATVAQRAYADAIEGRGSQILNNLGLIERAWLKIKDATKGALDAGLSLGRADSTEQLLVAAQAKLANLNQNGGLMSRGGKSQATMDVERGQLQQYIAMMSRRMLVDDNAATSAKGYSDQVAARIEWDKRGLDLMSKTAKMEREITEERNRGAAAGASQAEIEQRVAAIRARNVDKGALKSALAIDQAQLRSDLEAYKAASEQFANTTKTGQRVLEAQHALGLVGDQEYFRRKRDMLVEQDTVAEYYLQQEIARVQKEQSSLGGKAAIDNQTRLIDLRKQLAEVQANSAAGVAVIDAQQEASASRLAVSFLAARQSAQEFFDALQRQQARDLTFGQGSGARDFNAGADQISDRFDDQRRRLDNQRAQQLLNQKGGLTAEQQKGYDEELRLITEFQQKSTATYVAYYAKRVSLERNASLGAQEAVLNYLEEIGKVGKATEQAVGQSLRSLEDELTGLLTGKGFDAKKLVDQIIAEFLRLQVIRPIMQQALGGGGWLGAILGFLGGSTSGSGAGAYVSGAVGSSTVGMSLATGTNYVPFDGMRATLHEGEAVVPKQYNPAAGGRGGGDIIINTTNNIGQGVSRAEYAQALAASNAQLRADLMRQRSRGEGVFR